jgi:hypothetical protein
MSSTPANDVRRVRHQARDAASLMVFSAVVSVGAALTLVLLAHLGR